MAHRIIGRLTARLLRRLALVLAAVPGPLIAQPGPGAGPGRAPAPYALTEGQPIETRPPEKTDDRPAFPGQTRAPYERSVDYTVTMLTDQLEAPWSLAFLPDGKMLVTEKPGRMRIVEANGMLSEPLAGVPEVQYEGQVGLLDVALANDFPMSHRLFFTFSDAVSDANSQIVVARATLDEPAGALRDAAVIFRAKPDLPNAMGANQGGRIAIASDGMLFVTIGDRSQSPPWDVAQKLDNDLGKIIHITPEGEPAPGNPFANRTDALPEIWSYGHRSEEGLAFDPQGQLWETEHGPRGGDELNMIEAGKNYGWPVIVHGIDYPGTTIGEGITEKAGMEQPVYYWDPVIAPSGFAFYTGDLFPEWKGSVFVGALRGMMLDRLTLEGGKVVAEEPLLLDQGSRIRDVRVGPEGAVYVLTDDGKLLKLTPK